MEVVTRGHPSLDDAKDDRLGLIQHINLHLAALGLPTPQGTGALSQLQVAADLLRSYQHQKRLLADYRCPADQRIQNFLNHYLRQNGVESEISLPGATFVLDRPRLARELSLPVDGQHFSAEFVDSYRLLQGVLHNPRNDRRTTKGVFHIVEGGLPIPADKNAVPVNVFAALLKAALKPPRDVLRLPFTSGQADQAESWVSLLMRPLVAPEVPGISPEKTMETRFFAPGSLVSNLDFVERIFGNAGNPCLSENDAALDVLHWTGHTGCVILAPHLVRLKKTGLGLPHWDQASERQRRDGMCWRDENELYNGGLPFKITCRDMSGVIVTLIADNYFGYSKKEVKSQISYAANLFGGCEEEHSGGALAFPSYNLGEVFRPDSRIRTDGHDFDGLVSLFGDVMHVREEGYGIDKRFPDIIYVPEDATMHLLDQTVHWPRHGREQTIKLLAGHTYIHPCGYKVHMEKHPHAPSWRLIGTDAEGTFVHKPCTVSGGGKSEISKSIVGTIISGPFYVRDIHDDLTQVQAIFDQDYSSRFRNTAQARDSRSLLSDERTLGSVIKLLTPSESEYTGQYNQWLESIPQHIRALVFVIKRFYRAEWGAGWRKYFSVDMVNGYPGHELKYNGRRLVASFLRVGVEPDGAWRMYKLRHDFIGADKIQMEDDITASITVPSARLKHLNSDYAHPSVKLTGNCEQRLFQRPDDAIHRGLDLQAEADLAGPDNFISNFEPLTTADAKEMVEDAIGLELFSAPMKQLVQAAGTAAAKGYFVSSAHPRIVDGKPSANVRYLQQRPDLANPRDRYIAEMGARLYRRVPLSEAVHFPVNAVLPGRRNNPPDREHGIRSLAVYNPIHFQELPELFMDFIASLTGKSPSTTGAGSEGALTKGPFNALRATADLNNALVSYIISGYDGFSTAAGHIGPNRRVDHDISLLIPELWCRLAVRERDPQLMIERGYLEPLADFEYQGRTICASRLGYRITSRFVHANFGKIFDSPMAVFDEAMLRPESQDLESFADGVDNIVEAQRRVAQNYLDDGSINDACPPLKALLHIMATGSYEGKDAGHPEIRGMFTRAALLASDWYQERLSIKRQRDMAQWQRHEENLQHFLERQNLLTEVEREQYALLLGQAREELAYVESAQYLSDLSGTLGADWIHRQG
ncbi:MAG: hypothetical protein WC392_14250 [Sulfuricella sp.]|jgi:hypothetical protein